MRSHVLAVVALLLFAGCVTPFGPVDPNGGERGEPVAKPSVTDPTPAAATSAIQGGDGPPDANPWGTDPVVVAVENEGDRDRDFGPLVREATDFWARNDDRYLGFPVRYEVRPDAADPDLVVTYTDDVPDCGKVADAAGCAPLLTDPRQVDRPETLWVETGLSDSSTVLVTKHELGHTLGRTHADPPASVMRAASVLYTEPQPNATERSFPWDDGDFTTRIEIAEADDPDGAREQVDHALTYYADGAPGMPTNLTFERGERDPEIRIRVGGGGDCGTSRGSCVSTYGTDPDGDGAIETYTRAVITVADVDTDAVGWHVGYWLAHVLGAETSEEKPPPFREASPRERRSAWWA
jgi:hypothetical protein